MPIGNVYEPRETHYDSPSPPSLPLTKGISEAMSEGKDYKTLFNEVFGSTNPSTTTPQGSDNTRVPATRPLHQTQTPAPTNPPTPKRNPSVKSKLQPSLIFQDYDDRDTSRQPTVSKPISTRENTTTTDDKTGPRESTSRPSSSGERTRISYCRDLINEQRPTVTAITRTLGPSLETVTRKVLYPLSTAILIQIIHIKISILSVRTMR